MRIGIELDWLIVRLPAVCAQFVDNIITKLDQGLVPETRLELLPSASKTITHTWYITYMWITGNKIILCAWFKAAAAAVTAATAAAAVTAAAAASCTRRRKSACKNMSSVKVRPVKLL